MRLLIPCFEVSGYKLFQEFFPNKRLIRCLWPSSIFRVAPLWQPRPLWLRTEKLLLSLRIDSWFFPDFATRASLFNSMSICVPVTALNWPRSSYTSQSKHLTFFKTSLIPATSSANLVVLHEITKFVKDYSKVISSQRANETDSGIRQWRGNVVTRLSRRWRTQPLCQTNPLRPL